MATFKGGRSLEERRGFKRTLEHRNFVEWTALGSGSYGNVLEATLTTDGRRLAVKWQPIQSEEDNNMSLDDDDSMEDYYDDPSDPNDPDPTDKRDVVDEAVLSVLLGELTLPAGPNSNPNPSRPPHRRAPSFPRCYGAFKVCPPDRETLLETYPKALAQVLRPRVTYVAIVQELGRHETLRDRVIEYGQSYPETTAHAWAFELAWSLFVAYGQPGLLYHGDIKASNIVFADRDPAALAPDKKGVTFRLRSHLHGERGYERDLGFWRHRETQQRPMFIDFGFARYVVPNRKTPLPASGAVHLGSHYPPELQFGTEIESDQQRDWRSDTWQLGVVFLTLYGKMPAIVHEYFGSSFAGRDLSEAMRQDFLSFRCRCSDLIHVPMAFLEVMVSRRRLRQSSAVETYVRYPRDTFDGLTPVDTRTLSLATLTDEDLRQQMNVSNDFIELLFDHSAELSGQLVRTTQFRDKCLSILPVILLQTALGHDPIPRLARFANRSAFLTALQTPKIVSFIRASVANQRLPLMRLMKEIVTSLPPGVMAMLASMIEWDDARRISPVNLVMHPLFRDRFGSAPLFDHEEPVYAVFAHLPTLRNTLEDKYDDDDSVRAKRQRHRDWLARLHQTINQRRISLYIVRRSYADVEDQLLTVARTRKE